MGAALVRLGLCCHPHLARWWSIPHLSGFWPRTSHPSQSRFAHAPIIFPAVLGVPVIYSAAFYLHLGLLNLSLFARVFSDLLYDLPGRQWSSLFNAASVLVFLLVTSMSRGYFLKRSQIQSGGPESLRAKQHHTRNSISDSSLQPLPLPLRRVLGMQPCWRYS